MQKPEDLAQWICEEHERISKLTHELRCRVTADLPASGLGEWVAQTREQVAAFQSHLRNHFALEKDTGYLEAVVAHCPALAGEIDRLGQEHEHIDQILNSVQRALASAGEKDRLIAGDCRSRLLHLLVHMEGHEHREDVMGLGALG